MHDFNRLRDGRQAWCRACFRRYYEENRAQHRRRNDALKARRIAEAQAFVLDHLYANPCLDCGESDPIVLEFDHVGEKRSEVSTLVRRGVRLAALAGELAACEVVCANCHRRRTARRAGWRRVDDERSARPWRTKEHERNVRWASAILEASGCRDCGETDVRVLEFDHVGGAKTGGVMRLARGGAGLRRLAQEIEQCDVRCVNCHRRRTAIASASYRAREVPPARVELALPD